MCSVFKKYEGNPILTPNPRSVWDSYMVFNAAAIYVGDKFHLLYRARGRKGGVSKLGYASSIDGFHIDERLNKPVFEPEPENELESYGCEDPRLVEIENKIYLTYTAYGRIPGLTPSLNIIQIAMTNIATEDFIQKRWNWGPRYYPLPKVDNKHACIFPEKINGRWVMYHRIPPHIWIAYSDDLKSWGETSIVLSPRKGWNNFKIGGGAPPIKTEEGWLIIYHAVDREWNYWLEAAVADLNQPQKIIKRGDAPILKPEEEYEIKGDVPNTIFTCGAVLRNDTIYLYYSGADTVMCVATANIHELLESLRKI